MRWRIKVIDPVVIETRFADVERICVLSGQHFMPVIER